MWDEGLSLEGVAKKLCDEHVASVSNVKLAVRSSERYALRLMSDRLKAANGCDTPLADVSKAYSNLCRSRTPSEIGRGHL
jgi:hypothetical protein